MSDATKHTKGPWSVDNGTGQILGPRDGCSHVIVARMPVWFSGKLTGSHATQDQQAVNAALIAQAPTLLAQRDALLAALQHCLAYLESNADDDQERADYEQARAAIALAGGGL